MTRMYRRSKRFDLNDTLALCNYDTDRGHIAMALARMKDLEDEVGPDAKISYAEGLLRATCLGQGMRAFSLFVKAIKLNGNHIFAACNAASYSPTEADFRKWGPLASRLSPQDSSAIEQKFEELESGLVYRDLVLAKARHALASKGDNAAAYLELAVSGEECTRSEQLEFRSQRARLMIARDLYQDSILAKCGEEIPPEERLALQEAIGDLGIALKMDEHSSELYKLRADCAMRMRDYSGARSFAQRAVDIRPSGFSEPYLSLAIAMCELGDRKAAIESARKAKEEASDDKSRDLSERMIAAIAAGKSASRRQSPVEQVQWFYRSAMSGANHYAGVLGGRPDELAQSFKRRINGLLGRPSTAYVGAMGQLLAYAPAETAFAIVSRIDEVSRDHATKCTLAVVYIAAHGEPVMQRDAARFLILTIFSNALEDSAREGGDALIRSVKERFQRIVGRVAAASKDGNLSRLDDVVLTELKRMSPELAGLVGQSIQYPQNELRELRSYFEEELGGDPFINDSSKWAKYAGFLSVLVAVLLVGGVWALIKVLW